MLAYVEPKCGNLVAILVENFALDFMVKDWSDGFKEPAHDRGEGAPQCFLARVKERNASE